MSKKKTTRGGPGGRRNKSRNRRRWNRKHGCDFWKSWTPHPLHEKMLEADSDHGSELRHLRFQAKNRIALAAEKIDQLATDLSRAKTRQEAAFRIQIALDRCAQIGGKLQAELSKDLRNFKKTVRNWKIPEEDNKTGQDTAQK